MRTHRGLRTAQPLRHFFRGKIFQIPQHKRSPFPGRQCAQRVLQIVMMLAPQQQIFRTFRVALRRLINLTKRHPPMPAQEIKRRVGGNAGKPMRGFLLILQLLLPLQGFDERFLSQILRIGHVANHPINLQENAAKIVFDKPVPLLLTSQGSRVFAKLT